MRREFRIFRGTKLEIEGSVEVYRLDRPETRIETQCMAYVGLRPSASDPTKKEEVFILAVDFVLPS